MIWFYVCQILDFFVPLGRWSVALHFSWSVVFKALAGLTSIGVSIYNVIDW